LAAWGIVTLVQAVTGNCRALPGAIVLLAAVLIPTSFLPKQVLNTKVWDDHTIGSPESQALFAWMREGGIPKNSVVAHLCGDSEFLSGYDMNPPLWNGAFYPPRGTAEPYFVANPLNLTPESHAILKGAGVEYVTFGESCYRQTPQDQHELIDDRLHEAMVGRLPRQILIPVKSSGYEFLFRLR
jgi:hypothetical protein